jgi:hypothetical protein
LSKSIDIHLLQQSTVGTYHEFPKGLILEKLHSYGLLESHATEVAVAVAALNKKKALLARLLLRRHLRQPKCQEHRRNDTWMHHLEKAREKDGFFVKRYHMTEETFDKLVNLLDLPVNQRAGTVQETSIRLSSPWLLHTVFDSLVESHTSHYRRSFTFQSHHRKEQ